MRRILILAVGPLKERALREMCDDYYQRCEKRFKIEEREVKDLNALKKALPAKRHLILLDERGEEMRSKGFASYLERWMALPHPLVFAIGGADGFDAATKKMADGMVSLSRLTYPHRLVRVIFAEQLFRGYSIIEGLPYHRD